MLDKLAGFFRFVLGEDDGYICVAVRNAKSRSFTESFFTYPDDIQSAVKYCERAMHVADVWFCPTVLRTNVRKKESVETSIVAWSDLDECPPDALHVAPTLVVETSQGRWQGYWRFTEPVHALEVEALNKRIAYSHREQGADVSGWDLTQLMRVPGTMNHKRAEAVGLFRVRLSAAMTDRKYTLDDFSAYPGTEEASIVTSEAMPEEIRSAEDILEELRLSINPRVWSLFEQPPETDWSKHLWQLQLLLFDAGLSREDVFSVAREAACNKYKRDGRSEELLWKEVLRAHAQYEGPVAGYAAEPTAADVEFSDALALKVEPLLTDAEREWCKATPTIVEEYIEWAKSIGDAAWQYHQAGAFVILATLLAGTVKLPTSFGTVIPNLWFMILADTTLTRKTTAMDMAMELLLEVDPDCVLATDGSIEGLLTSLSMRPGRPSIFLRDEFSGLLEQLTKRDYYAGMLETLTKLYDGKFQKRVLRKETLEVRDPVLILFAGGIRERIMQQLTYDHVNSGFIPRFCFITAESDVTKLRPLGPPTTRTLERRDALAAKFRQVWSHYNRIENPDPLKLIAPKTWNAELTDEAWVKYNRFEAAMMQSGLDSNVAEILTPTFDRLCKSGLKAAVLLSAGERLEEKIIVHEADLVRAFFYVEQWREHTLEVIRNIGKSGQERVIERVYNDIKRNPGVSRSKLMQKHRLLAREADLVFITLMQRNLITDVKNGRAITYHPVKI
jgi:hypothetical protein